MHFTGTKSSPWILLLLKYKKCSACMEAIELMQCIIMENTLIHDETKERDHDSQIVRAKENLKLSHGGSSYRLASGTHCCFVCV